jgi:hypothetical protein
MNDTGKEKRRSPRIDFECGVLVQIGDVGYFSFMENLSEAGCCIHRPKGWTALVRGAPVHIWHNLGRGRSEAVAANTVWSNDTYLGFEYGSPRELPPELRSITVGHDAESFLLRGDK